MKNRKPVDTLTKVLVLLFIVTIPIILWAVLTQRFELRKRATSTEPSICNPIGNTITVTPLGGVGTCHDLQTAINNAPDGMNNQFIIQLKAGTYFVPEILLSHSIMIANRTRLTIQGESTLGSNAVRLIFQGNNGGIRIENSNLINFEWMEILGNTANGLFSLYNTSNSSIGYIKLSDTGAHTVDMTFGEHNSIYNCEISSLAGAISIQNVNNFSFNNCEVHDADNGVGVISSTGHMIGNTIHNVRENGISISNSSVNIEHNTITNNTTRRVVNQAGLYVRNYSGNATNISLQNTIITYNYNGIVIDDASTTTISALNNNVFGNEIADTSIYQYPSGSNGNISENPLFGTFYCLQTGSPSIYGDPALGQIMGSKGICASSVTPSPQPITMGFDIAVRLSGVTDNKAEGTRAMFRFVKGNLNLITPPIPLTYTNDGIYLAHFNVSSSQLPPGSGYTMIVKGEKHVAKKFCKTTGQTEPCQPYETFDIPTPTTNTWVNGFNFTGWPLDPGDLFVQDNKADSFDFAKIKDRLSISCSDLTAEDKLIADLDYNGCVNIVDAFLMRKTLETRYDEN